MADETCPHVPLGMLYAFPNDFEFVCLLCREQERETVKSEIENNDIDELAREIQEWARGKGWDEIKRHPAEWIALAHTELSEAFEAYRLAGMEDWYNVTESIVIDDDYTLAKPEGYWSELADTIIRILHNFKEAPHPPSHYLREKMTYNTYRAHRHGGKLA